MSVTKLKLLSVIGVKKQLDKVVEVLGSCECFHTEDVLSLYSEEETKGFSTVSDENPYEKPLNDMIGIASDVNKFYLDCDDKINPDREPSLQQMTAYVKKLRKDLNCLLDKKQDIHQQLNKVLSSKNNISHFAGINLNFETITKCNYIKIRLGRLPNESMEKLARYEDNPFVLFFTCTTDQFYHWGMYVTPINHVDEVDAIFSGLSFERLRIYDVETTPEEEIVKLDEKINKLNLEYEQVIKDIDKLWSDNLKKSSVVFADIKKFYTYSNIKKQAAEYNRCFIISGWVPEGTEDKIREKLKKIPAIESLAEDSSGIKEHMVPTKLKNRKLFKPFEQFVSMYGVPSGKEVDPTIFVSITYSLIFGMMFGDFGNGLVLAVAGYIMNKFLKISIGKILIPCGITSMIFGFIFGSCFGFEHAFDWFYVGTLKMDKKPISPMESDTIPLILLAAISVGVIFIIIAMFMNIYSSIKQKKIGRALFGANGLAGMVFYVSLLAGASITLLTGNSVLTLPYVLCLIVLPLIIIMFEPILGGLVERRKDWKPESMGEFIMQSFFETVEVVLSFATNTISFLRIGAYILVHEGMLLVVFTLAEMGGSPFVFWLIVIIGNIAVIVIEGLLVSIQTLRLEFYEMFSRFYDGGGKAFEPVCVPSNKELMISQN